MNNAEKKLNTAFNSLCVNMEYKELNDTVIKNIEKDVLKMKICIASLKVQNKN